MRKIYQSRGTCGKRNQAQKSSGETKNQVEQGDQKYQRKIKPSNEDKNRVEQKRGMGKKILNIDTLTENRIGNIKVGRWNRKAGGLAALRGKKNPNSGEDRQNKKIRQKFSYLILGIYRLLGFLLVL